MQSLFDRRKLGQDWLITLMIVVMSNVSGELLGIQRMFCDVMQVVDQCLWFAIKQNNFEAAKQALSQGATVVCMRVCF